MLKSGGFWHRLFTALVSASLVFSPFYIWAFSTAVNSPFNHEVFWVSFLNSLDTFALCETVILAAVMFVAYPVERFFNRETKSTIRNAATYAFVGILIATGFFLISLTQFGSGNYWPIIGLYVAIFGTVTAFIGRLIYPILLKIKKTVFALTAIVAALTLTGLLLQPIQASSPQADDFYPSTFEGEVARASWDVNKDGSAGTNQNIGSGKYDPNLSYNLTYRCSEDKGAKFDALIRRQGDLKTLKTVSITCDSTAVQATQVDLGNNALDVSLFLSTSGWSGSVNGTSSHPSTWAVLAPVKAN